MCHIESPESFWVQVVEQMTAVWPTLNHILATVSGSGAVLCVLVTLSSCFVFLMTSKASLMEIRSQLK